MKQIESPQKQFTKYRELWSSGYRRKFTIEGLWVQIPVKDIKWIFLTLICCTILYSFIRPKIKVKEAGNGLSIKWWLRSVKNCTFSFSKGFRNQIILILRLEGLSTKNYSKFTKLYFSLISLLKSSDWSWLGNFNFASLLFFN